MKILVTGSEGSLAQMVIPELLGSGHEIVGCDSFARYGRIERERPYDFVHADLSDSSQVDTLFEGHAFDAIFHFAALVYGVVGFHSKPADIIADNNLMVMHLLKRGHERCRRFVYLSSSMVYETSRSWPHREPDADAAPVMSTSYGLSKYVGERVVRAFHDQYGTEFTIWRPFNIITPFETPEEEGFSHVFSDLVEKILARKLNPVPILGDGEQVRCFTNIRDVADAIGRFSLDDRARNEIFNIGNPEPVTVRELAAKIVGIGRALQLLPEDWELDFDCRPTFSDDVRKRIPEVEKMRRVFGWRAKIEVDESLEQYIRHAFPEAG
jgi:nucleoside-diphosphate-sugar epimerase